MSEQITAQAQLGVEERFDLLMALIQHLGLRVYRTQDGYIKILG